MHEPVNALYIGDMLHLCYEASNFDFSNIISFDSRRIVRTVTKLKARNNNNLLHHLS